MVYTNQNRLFYSQCSYSTSLASVVLKIFLWYSQNQMFFKDMQFCELVRISACAFKRKTLKTTTPSDFFLFVCSVLS